MSDGLTALVGMHDSNWIDIFEGNLKAKGYVMTAVSNPQAMIKRAQEAQYDCYVMDLNLGFPGDLFITPAEKVYAIVKERVEAGKARFIGISVDAKTVANAVDAGIPAINKDTFRLRDWLNAER